MRIFVALLLPEDLKEKIVTWQAHHSELNLRLIEKRNLHITIIPPWESDDISEARKILAKFENSIGPQNLNFTEINWGPTQKDPRLIWAKSATPKELESFRDDLAIKLEMELKYKDLLCHVTLGRCSPATACGEALFKTEISWTDTISEFAIMESKLLDTGAEYSIIEKWQL